jgi:membrane protein YdbS with pleckstrin-like domain
MNWLDIQIWKQSFISTLICLLGCSIGVMGTAYYLVGFNLLLVLLISLIAGFITCMIFMIGWEVTVHKMNLREAIKHSYKMSIVSIMIMMLTENLILLFIIPKFSSHQMQIDMGARHDFGMMAIAMGFGFIFSLPYNYYQLQKTGRICHDPMEH